jgi:DNA primase large subunit
LTLEIQYLDSLDEEEPSDEKHQEPFDDAKLMQALEENMTETVNEERDRFKDMYASSAPRYDPLEQKRVEEQWKKRGRNLRRGMIRTKRAQLQATVRDVQSFSRELETEKRNDDERRMEEMKQRGSVKEEWENQKSKRSAKDP